MCGPEYSPENGMIDGVPNVCSFLDDTELLWPEFYWRLQKTVNHALLPARAHAERAHISFRRWQIFDTFHPPAMAGKLQRNVAVSAYAPLTCGQTCLYHQIGLAARIVAMRSDGWLTHQVSPRMVKELHKAAREQELVFGAQTDGVMQFHFAIPETLFPAAWNWVLSRYPTIIKDWTLPMF